MLKPANIGKYLSQRTKAMGLDAKVVTTIVDIMAPLSGPWKLGRSKCAKFLARLFRAVDASYANILADFPESLPATNVEVHGMAVDADSGKLLRLYESVGFTFGESE